MTPLPSRPFTPISASRSPLSELLQRLQPASATLHSQSAPPVATYTPHEASITSAPISSRTLGAIRGHSLTPRKQRSVATQITVNRKQENGFLRLRGPPVCIEQVTLEQVIRDRLSCFGVIDRIDIDETVSATIATITFQAESSALAVLKIRNSIFINGTRFLVESASGPVIEEAALMCEYRPKTTSHLQEAVSAMKAYDATRHQIRHPLLRASLGYIQRNGASKNARTTTPCAMRSEAINAKRAVHALPTRPDWCITASASTQDTSGHRTTHTVGSSTVITESLEAPVDVPLVVLTSGIKRKLPKGMTIRPAQTSKKSKHETNENSGEADAEPGCRPAVAETETDSVEVPDLISHTRSFTATTYDSPRTPTSPCFSHAALSGAEAKGCSDAPLHPYALQYGMSNDVLCLPYQDDECGDHALQRECITPQKTRLRCMTPKKSPIQSMRNQLLQTFLASDCEHDDRWCHDGSSDLDEIAQLAARPPQISPVKSDASRFDGLRDTMYDVDDAETLIGEYAGVDVIEWGKRVSAFLYFEDKHGRVDDWMAGVDDEHRNEGEGGSQSEEEQEGVWMDEYVVLDVDRV